MKKSTKISGIFDKEAKLMAEQNVGELTKLVFAADIYEVGNGDDNGAILVKTVRQVPEGTVGRVVRYSQHLLNGKEVWAINFSFGDEPNLETVLILETQFLADDMPE